MEELLKMIDEDKLLTRVAGDWTRPENPESIGISNERIASYQEQLKKGGIKHGFEAVQKDEVVYFILATSGLSISGYAMGIAYVRDDGNITVVENLDALPTPPPEGEFFERIEGNWYMFYDIRR